MHDGSLRGQSGNNKLRSLFLVISEACVNLNTFVLGLTCKDSLRREISRSWEVALIWLFSPFGDWWVYSSAPWALAFGMSGD